MYRYRFEAGFFEDPLPECVISGCGAQVLPFREILIYLIVIYKKNIQHAASFSF
jgi:hypothetical protein